MEKKEDSDGNTEDGVEEEPCCKEDIETLSNAQKEVREKRGKRASGWIRDPEEKKLGVCQGEIWNGSGIQIEEGEEA